MGSRTASMVTILGIILLITEISQNHVIAGPVRRSSRMIREIYPEIEPEKIEPNQADVCIVGDVIYGVEETVPAEQPCLTCKCKPPGVQCETTKCIKKPGCRAIHKPNKCCPEYQCECEHEGRIYANGERLETPPGGECRVCYCRGGELQCADVSCYIRTDCEGRTVQGQCCPKYDHCPPREPLFGDGLLPYSTPSPVQSNFNSTDNLPPTLVYDLQDISNEDSNKITETQFFSTKHDQNSAFNINVQDVPIQTEEDDLNKVPPVPTITIQEIIPEIKEIPITGPPKREINLQAHGFNLEEKMKNKDVPDAEADSSEITEVYHPPPVLKIGDQLLFLRKGELVPGKDISTPVPVITIIGAEGLQRGGTEDSGEFHEVPSQVQGPESSTTEKSSHILSLVKPRKAEASTKSAISMIEDLLVNMTKDKPTEESLDPVVLTLDTVKTVTNAANPTKAVHKSDSKVSGDEEIKLEDMITPAIELTISVEPEQNTTVNETSRYEDLGEAKPRHEEEIEQNPEYPPIPDIMSPQNLDELSEHLDVELAQFPVEFFNSSSNNTDDSKILPDILDVRDNVTIPSSNHSSWLKNSSVPSPHPLINPKAALPTAILDEIAVNDDQVVEENSEDDVTTDIYENDNDTNISQLPQVREIENGTSQTDPTESELQPRENIRITNMPPSVATEENATVLAVSVTELTNETRGFKAEPRHQEMPKLVSSTQEDEYSKVVISSTVSSTTVQELQLTESTKEENQQLFKSTTEGAAIKNINGDPSVNSSKSTTESENRCLTRSVECSEDRSREIIEVEESGETVTPSNRHASILLSSEDASVESTNSFAPSSVSSEMDMTDLVESIPEVVTQSVKPSTTAKPLIERDVEIINAEVLKNSTKAKKTAAEEESDGVFRELNEELQTVPSRMKHENDDQEAEAIFRELLEEATSSTISPKSSFPKAGEKETALLQRVSDAITKFQLKESKESLDASILGILRDFFSSQYKYYDE